MSTLSILTLQDMNMIDDSPFVDFVFVVTVSVSVTLILMELSGFLSTAFDEIDLSGAHGTLCPMRRQLSMHVIIR